MAFLEILGTAAGLGSAAQGYQAQQQANKLNKRALDQVEYDYNARAPMRRQGMQALGQVEGAWDLGNIGVNSANPFAAARGPAQSTAKIGNWDQIATTNPETMDNAIMGVTDDDLAWAQDALTRKRPDGSYAYKASERNHAQRQIMDKATQRAGLAGIQPLLGQRVTAARTRNASRGRFEPLGMPSDEPLVSGEPNAPRLRPTPPMTVGGR
jgi:hypothetical protein